MPIESKCEECPNNAGFYCTATDDEYRACLKNEQIKDIEDYNASLR